MLQQTINWKIRELWVNVILAINSPDVNMDEGILIWFDFLCFHRTIDSTYIFWQWIENSYAIFVSIRLGERIIWSHTYASCTIPILKLKNSSAHLMNVECYHDIKAIGKFTWKRFTEPQTKTSTDLWKKYKKKKSRTIVNIIFLLFFSTYFQPFFFFESVEKSDFGAAKMPKRQKCRNYLWVKKKLQMLNIKTNESPY